MSLNHILCYWAWTTAESHLRLYKDKLSGKSTLLVPEIPQIWLRKEVLNELCLIARFQDLSTHYFMQICIDILYLFCRIN